jgi:uncharacterized RDD family membrane protein YckC
MNGSPSESDSPVHALFSPEGVRLDLAIAGPAPRMLAYGVDLLIIIVLLLFLFLTLPFGSSLSHWFASFFHHAADKIRQAAPSGGTPVQIVSGVVVAVILLAQFAVESGYFILWEMLTGGRSPGKALLGLRVVQRSGLPIELGNSMVRNVFRIVDMLPASYVVGLISILLSPGCERLGDHVAGTVVIRLDRPPAAPEIQAAANPESLLLTREQLARIGSRELRLIRGTLRRLSTIPEDRREALLAEVTDSLRRRLELTELPFPDRQEFLRDLLSIAERYSRDQGG